MEKDEHYTKVIFRKFKKEGSIIALFPELAGNTNPATCSSYMHIGQHSAASTGIIADTLPATPEEYEDLRKELEDVIGYKLQIVHKFTYKAYRIREEEINK